MRPTEACLINLSAVPAPNRAWSNPKVTGLGISASWEMLARAEPRLEALRREVLVVKGVDYRSCPMNQWYGYENRARGIKYRLSKLVGNDSPEFWAAYAFLCRELKICRHCLGRDLTEADIEGDVIARLRDAGLHARRQVRVPSGIADIVTATAVYEVKLWLTRDSLFRAIGQVTLYAAELGGDRQRVIIGQRTDETDVMGNSIRKSGITLDAWW